MKFILNQSKLRFRRFAADEFTGLEARLAKARGTAQEPAAQAQLGRLLACPTIILVYNASQGPGSLLVEESG
jgi:hypothetical protein